MVPTSVLPPEMLSTVQVTEVLVDPLTVVVNCCVCPEVTVAAVGLIATETLLVTVTVALALLVLSAELVAVIVCIPAAEGAI
jgi:hypothetical protein